jgi:hypothetical protein
VGTDAGALDAIVDRSATLNQSQGITGMLWSDGSSFAQVLEGEYPAVAGTMNRIRVDRRHTEVEVVLDRANEAIPARAAKEAGSSGTPRACKSYASASSLARLLQRLACRCGNTNMHQGAEGGPARQRKKGGGNYSPP